MIRWCSKKLELMYASEDWLQKQMTIKQSNRRPLKKRIYKDWFVRNGSSPGNSKSNFQKVKKNNLFEKDDHSDSDSARCNVVSRRSLSAPTPWLQSRLIRHSIIDFYWLSRLWLVQAIWFNWTHCRVNPEIGLSSWDKVWGLLGPWWVSVGRAEQPNQDRMTLLKVDLIKGFYEVIRMRSS